MYSGDISLVFRYMLLMPKHPKLASGVDMKLFTRILVFSYTGVSVLFSPSYSNIFPPEVNIILLGSYFCGRVSATNLAYVTIFCLVNSLFLMDSIESIPLIRSFSFLVFPMPCINRPYSLAPTFPQAFCFSGFFLFSSCLNFIIWPSLSSRTECA